MVTAKAKKFQTLYYHIVTFKDLQKLVESQSSNSNSSPELQKLINRLRDKKFWIWDQQQHKERDRVHKGDCCFNHIVGLPRRDGIQKENCQKIEYNPNKIVPEAKKSIGIDHGFGSSNFAIVATQLVDGKIQVIYAEEYPRASFPDMIDKIWKLKQQYCAIRNQETDRINIYVHAANPEIWSSLKKEFAERYDVEYIRETIAHCKKYNIRIEDRMLVVPVPFSTEGAKMLQHTKWLLEETEEDGSSLITIHPHKFAKLVTSLRTAVANEYKLDKVQTSYNDILDAFRLALQFYKRTK